MGFFSWKTSDTKKAVRNRYTPEGATPCAMIDDAGNIYHKDNYDGYGVFGGVDYFELLDKMNGGDGDDRDRGIFLDFSSDEPVRRPKIVSPGCSKSWDELPDSESAPCQGYF